jgi:hypothetical protein
VRDKEIKSLNVTLVTCKQHVKDLKKQELACNSDLMDKKPTHKSELEKKDLACELKMTALEKDREDEKKMINLLVTRKWYSAS